MTLDTHADAVRFVSIGIDATDLSRYHHTITDEGDLLVYDEGCEEAWMQSALWIQAESMC